MASFEYGQVRRHEHNGDVFMIRDVWTPGGAARGRLIRCEYATANDKGGVKWTPCREGVSFDEIKPVGHVEYINVEKVA